MHRFFILSLVIIFLQIGCASWKKETLAYMGGGLVAGGVLGASQAPNGENKAMHGALWGSVAAAAIGATLIYLKDDDVRLREKEMEIQTLKMEISAGSGRKRQIEGGPSQFVERELPEGVKDLVAPGEWYLYQIDEWKKTSKGEYIHQDKLLEFKPPKVKIK